MNKEEKRKRHLNAVRKWVKNNIEKQRESHRKSRDKYLSNPESNKKMLVRMKVYYALKIGRLIKPNCCETCKQIIKIDAHHPDYSKPLEVMWLCKSCHTDIHLKK